MKFLVRNSNISGDVLIPGSKSHTIRALVIALLSKGESVIEHPLVSSDTLAGLSMIKDFGADVKVENDKWVVHGIGSDLPIPPNVIDVGNSGTSLYIGMGVASLIAGTTIFTGDEQIRRRPADALLKSINDLGGDAYSTTEDGTPPLVIKGPISGGETSVEAITSQYLSSLLMAAPLAKGDTTIKVPLLNEKPYVTMTLKWLEKCGIEFKNNGYKEFIIKGNQSYNNFKEHIAADFSSATFFLVAAAITGCELNLIGLDFEDSQGDKAVVDILKEMGAEVEIGKRNIRIKGKSLKGGIFDLNDIPDALPALAVAACFAEGETRLVNVAQARVKETDRISVMYKELKKLGADVEELEDGIVVRKSSLKGGKVNGHDDHRIVMALSIAGLRSESDIEISTAEAVSVTFPGFMDLMKNIGANIEKVEE